MLEAVVGVALRAIVASVLLGGLLAALVLVATRALALTAATRHALWTTALIATALMPLAGVGVSVARAYASPPDTPVTATAGNASGGAASFNPPSAARGRTAAPPARESAATPASASALAPPAAGPSLVDRLAFAAWTPRLTRALAALVVGVWALGALIGLVGLAASIARVRGLKRRSSPLDGALADELPWLTEAATGREIYLRLSYEIETPVAIGFRRPVILIPTELATADGLAAIESLVLHEYAHLRRMDDWTNLVQRSIERIFWFNPIVWLVGRRIALEREIASDDAVVEKTGEAHAYASSLWRLAREMRMPEHAVVAPGALLTRKQITVRIEQLLDKRRARLHRSPAAALGVALAGVLSVGFVATSAPAVELPATASPPAASASDARAVAEHHATRPMRKIRMHVVAAGAMHDPALTADTARATTTHGHATASAHGAMAGNRVTAERVHVREHYIIVHDKQSAPSGSGASGTSSLAPPAPAAPPQPAELPPAPATPPLPPLPPLAVSTLSPNAVKALRRASEAASQIAAAHVQEATQAIGPEVARQIHDAMAALPREIAQDSPRRRVHRRYDNVKLTRELVAACVGCSFRNADGRGADLHDVKIVGDDFSGADMRGVNLAGAQLSGVSLAGANLANADLRRASLSGVDLDRANFAGAQLEGVTLTGISMQRTSFRGPALRSAISSCTGCDFSRMDLHGQDLHGIVLNGADLSRADLRGANLSGVRFSGVDLSGADLTGADLTNARLDGCDISGTDLRNARVTGMVLHGSSAGE